MSSTSEFAIFGKYACRCEIQGEGWYLQDRRMALLPPRRGGSITLEDMATTNLAVADMATGQAPTDGGGSARGPPGPESRIQKVNPAIRAAFPV